MVTPSRAVSLSYLSRPAAFSIRRRRLKQIGLTVDSSSTRHGWVEGKERSSSSLSSITDDITLAESQQSLQVSSIIPLAT